MPDITKCTGNSCPKKDCCYRYTVEDSPYWQSYSDFSPNAYHLEIVNICPETNSVCTKGDTTPQEVFKCPYFISNGIDNIPPKRSKGSCRK